MASAQTRAETAMQLREEAHKLLADTGLFALLQNRFGDPWVTGSAGYDLMVWRHINIELAIEATRLTEWIGFGAEIAIHLDEVGLGLPRANFANGYIEPGPRGHGLHWTLFFSDFEGHPWQVDIWGWDPFDYAVRQARDFTLRTDLQSADRDLILRLKSEARQRTNYYGNIVTAFDIYRFAIAKAGDSLSALEKWKAAS
jgi:hypothetical protein